MRPGLTHHRKFRRLARLVGSDVLALGHLEWLWATAYEDGNDLIGDSDDVESAAHWTGTPGALTSALLTAGGDAAGFIEEVTPGRYRIHDFWHHAPAYVSRRRKREHERKTKADPVSVTDQSVTSQCPASDEALYSTPSTQHPAPSTKEQDPRPTPTDEDFETFWTAYPKHVAKDDARKAWRKLKPSEGLQSVILSAVADQRTWRTWSDVKFVPNAASWLNGKRWTDERPADDRPSNRAPAVNGSSWCDHDPPCRTQPEHTARYLDEQRALRSGLRAVAS